MELESFHQFCWLWPLPSVQMLFNWHQNWHASNTLLILFSLFALISHWLEDKFLLCWNPGHLLSDKRTFPSLLELTLLSSQVSGGVTSGQQEMSLLIRLTQNLISTLDFINTKSGFHFFPWTQYLVPRFSPILHWIFKLGNKSSSTCS